MQLKSLQLVNFKNYAEAALIFSPEINCLVGKNGSGKTNILDAIYYLSMCRSYLNPIDSQNIKFGEAFFILQSKWQHKTLETEVFCSIKKGQKKIVKRNKVAYEKLAEHIGSFPTVIISPYDRNLITEGSEFRRKWMDSTISQIDKPYLDLLLRYTKVIGHRNALLKNNQTQGFFDAESFEVWDDQLVKMGEAISNKRQMFLEEFIPLFQYYYTMLGEEAETVHLRFETQIAAGNFAEILFQNQKKDLLLGYTTVGIHKDDLGFELNGNLIKKFGSQGQQKSYLIALKLAQFDFLKNKLNTTPILLLDDIFDKLDNHRVARLMKLVANDTFGQVMVTDTDEDRLKAVFSESEKRVYFFTVNEAKIVSHDLEKTEK
jgi:DNA replication and repair protein RecF